MQYVPEIVLPGFMKRKRDENTQLNAGGLASQPKQAQGANAAVCSDCTLLAAHRLAAFTDDCAAIAAADNRHTL